jgi:glycosyltransferase involved in cell wall biosynthesis
MVVGYEAKRVFSNFTGLGNYARTLLNNALLFGPQEYQPLLFTPKKIHHPRTQFLLENTQQVLPAGSALLWRSYRQQFAWSREGLDLYHGLSGELPLVHSSIKIPLLVTIHDVIFRQYPKMYQPWDRWIYHRKTQYALDRADGVIAISEATKNALMEHYRVEPSKIVVLYQAADPIFENFSEGKGSQAGPTQYALPPDYWLYVGAVNERKQLLKVFEALASMPKAERIPVVVVGEGGAYWQAVKKYIHANDLSSYCIAIPKVDFSLLPSIYHQAKALIYPSLFEGFGIPLIEALWTGCPVITSNTSSMPEAAGENSFLINPHSVEELRETMRVVLQGGEHLDHRRAMGRNHVEKFRGLRVTEQLFSLYASWV